MQKIQAPCEEINDREYEKVMTIIKTIKTIKTYTEIMQGDSRIAGVLLHPTSLPSGKLDQDAFRWLDFMADAGLRLWQVLPLGVPQGNLSPYQCYSAFAMNPALLGETAEAIDEPDNYFVFQQWYQQEKYWLDDYALFMVLKQVNMDTPWYEWPQVHKQRCPDALDLFRQHNQDAIIDICWQQYQLYKSWDEIRDYANQRSMYLFGDMPLFVAHDSADVWANQDSFLLDEHGMPISVAGVPPDYFSETGQRWGNPHYNWETMQGNNFDWWCKRLKNHLQCFDVVRIDHFRGLEAVWVIDTAHETAIDGEWQQVPGEKMLQALKDELGEVALVAEDLGIITEEVEAMRKRLNLPGMSVLQFSFNESEDNPHKPQNITHDRVVYSGTHDNDTTQGWFDSLDEETQQYVMNTLEIDHPEAATNSVIDTALASAAQLAVFPLQDFLQLGSEARMNTPGTMDGNWQWQFTWDQIPEDLADNLKQRIKAAGR